MNIFVLDKDPKTCASYHCDKHVVKMILEHVQMLCTVSNTVGIPAFYKPTHANHPCTKWVGESRANWDWLVDLTLYLNDEYMTRYNHPINHLAWQKTLWWLPFDDVYAKLPDIPMTPFAQAMPEQYKQDDVVAAYREYYIQEKCDIATWTNREQPDWWTL